MNNTVANSFLPRYARLSSRKKQRGRDTRASKHKKDLGARSFKHNKLDTSLHQTKSTGAHMRKNIKRAVPPHVTDKRLTLRGTVSTSPLLRGELMYEAKKKQSRHDLKYLLAAAKGHKSKNYYCVKQSKSYRQLDVTSDSSSDPDDPDKNESLSSHASLDNAHSAGFLDNDELVFREQHPQILHTVNAKKLASKTFQPVRPPQAQTVRNGGFALSDSFDEFSIPDGHMSPQLAEKETHPPLNENCGRSLYKNRISPEFPHRECHDDLSMAENSTAAITNQLSFSTYLNFTIRVADHLKLEAKKMFPGVSYFTEVQNSLQAISRQGGIRNLEPEMIQNDFTEDEEKPDICSCFLGASGERNGICRHLSDQPENYPKSHVLSLQDSLIMTEGSEFGYDAKNKANEKSTEHLEDEGYVLRLKKLSEMKVDAWLSANFASVSAEDCLESTSAIKKLSEMKVDALLSANDFASVSSVDCHESTSAIKTQYRERGISSQVNNKKRMKLGSPKHEKHMISPEISNKKQFTVLNSISPQNEIDIYSSNVMQHTCSTHFLQNAPFLKSLKDVRQRATAYVPTSIEFLERTLGKNSKNTSRTKQNEPRRIEGLLDRNDRDTIHNMVNSEIKYSSQGSGRTWIPKTTHNDGGSLTSQRSMDFPVSSSEHLEMSHSLSVRKKEIPAGIVKTLQSDINVDHGYSDSSSEVTLLESIDIGRAQQVIQDGAQKKHSDPKKLTFFKLHRRKMY